MTTYKNVNYVDHWAMQPKGAGIPNPAQKENQLDELTRVTKIPLKRGRSGRPTGRTGLVKPFDGTDLNNMAPRNV